VAGPARPLREVTIWFVLVATVVHVIRANVLDVLVFLGTAVLILLDARRPVPQRLGRPGWFTPAVAVLVCVGYGLLVLPMARTGWPMRAAVAVPGVLALVVVLGSGRHLVEQPPAVRPRRSWLVWAAPLAFGCLFQLFNFFEQPDPETDSYAHPTLSSIVDPMLAGSPSRAVFVAVWLAIGIWLAGVLLGPRARADRP
jgi:hypothetical protein